jgi:hypothetical protein
MPRKELWRPRLDILPLFEDLGLEECDIPTLATFCSPLMAANVASPRTRCAPSLRSNPRHSHTKKYDLVSCVDQQYLNVNADAALYAAQYGSPTTKAPLSVPKFA